MEQASSSGQRQALNQLLPLRTVAGPSFFAVHPSGGLSWCYAPLAGYMGDQWSLYGLQVSGLDGTGELPATLAAMAADYVRAIRTLQPSGPCRLLGWSLGGVVAHEMAVQLREVGEEVAALVILDAFPVAPSTSATSAATPPTEPAPTFDGLLSGAEAETAERVRRHHQECCPNG